MLFLIASNVARAASSSRRERLISIIDVQTYKAYQDVVPRAHCPGFAITAHLNSFIELTLSTYNPLR